ncbi:MAG: hypothetical protein HQM13_02075 [SAR324 cluster bacterium]|nr:hypothetical protein [SAR324 cluster bacterium]
MLGNMIAWRSPILTACAGFFCLFQIGCKSQPSPQYAYPTAQSQNVDYLCTIVYEPQYALLLVNSRQSRISKIAPVEEGLIAYFNDGNKVVLPIASGLPLGEEFHCGQRDKHYPCLIGDNQDPNCTR